MTKTFRGDEEILIPYEFDEVEIDSESSSIEVPYEHDEIIIEGAAAGTVPYRVLLTQALETVRDTSDDILLARS